MSHALLAVNIYFIAALFVNDDIPSNLPYIALTLFTVLFSSTPSSPSSSLTPAILQVSLLCPCFAYSTAEACSSACKCAPDLRSNETCSFKSAFAARNNGVRPEQLRRCTELPCKRKWWRISRLGDVAARCCMGSPSVDT